MPPMLGRVGTVLEMIKVVVREIQDALRALSNLGRIRNTGFRTPLLGCCKGLAAPTFPCDVDRAARLF